MRHRIFAVAALATLLLPLGGCAYELRGIVLESDDGPPTVDVVGSGDSRLQEQGLRSTIELTVDPDGHQPDYMEPIHTDTNGRFRIAIKETGAGFLMYKLEVIAHAEGHAGARETIDLPAGFERVVIMLPRGRDSIKRPQGFDSERQGMEKMERDLRGAQGFSVEEKTKPR